MDAVHETPSAEDTTSSLPRWLKAAAATVAALMIVYHVHALAFGVPEAMRFRPIHVGFILVLCILLYTMRRGGTKRTLTPLDCALLAAGIFAIGWTQVGFDRIVERYPYFSPVATGDIVAFCCLAVCAFEACRRTIGWTLPIIAVLAVGQAIFGGIGPAMLQHDGVEFTRLVDHLLLTTSGAFNSLIGVSASYIFSFTLFGACLLMVRAGDAFMDLSVRLTAHTTAGAAKASIVSSSFFGMLSGSAIANIYTTGSITIPLMKRSGLKPHSAGAVEATASNVGNWMPPVMGSSAFLVAEYAGTTYAYVALIAIPPAVIYILGLFASVHFMAERDDLRVRLIDLDPEAAERTFGQSLARWWHLLVPIALLVVLLVMDFSPYLAALVAAAVTLIVGMLRPHTRYTLRDLSEGLVSFGTAVAPIGASLVLAALIVGSLELTGVTLKFTSAIVATSEGGLALTLVMVAAAAIVLGMGLPNVAAYVVTMIFGVPALMEAGVDRLVAHMFVFYFANLSSITPPVCLASFAAAAVAKADTFKTAFTAVRLAIGAFMLPFVVAYNPVLLFQGDLVPIVVGCLTATLAVVLLAAAGEGWLLARVSVLGRIALALAGIALVVPGWPSDILGLALLAAVAGPQYLRRSNARAKMQERRAEP